MEQYITKNKYTPSFFGNTIPTMAYLYKINGESSDCIRAMHSHRRLVEISVITHGQSSYIIDGKRYEVKKGDIIILNAGVVHEEFFGDAQICTFCLGIANLHLKGKKFGTLISDDVTPVFSAGEHSHAVLALIEMIFWQRTTQQQRMEETCHYLTMSLISLLLDMTDHLKIKKKSDEKNEILASEICGYLDQHFAELISLQDIAETLHVSKYHICHIYKEYMKCSITQYVQRRRIGEAQSLLIETSYSAAHIGTMTGYSNPSDFGAKFKRLVGMTPLQYRNTREALKQGTGLEVVIYPNEEKRSK